jgi:hypothetical protein
MNDEVVVNFDPKPSVNKREPCRITLKARTENIVGVPTTSKGLGLLPRGELLPGVYLASSLTRAANSICVTGIINTTETDKTLELPCVDFKDLDNRKCIDPDIHSCSR